MGETVAAEFRGLTWAELRPEAGEGPLATGRSGRSGVLPVEEAVEVSALEFVGVFVAERLFKAINLALTASK